MTRTSKSTGRTVAEPSQIGAVAQVPEGGGHPTGGGTNEELRTAGLHVAQERSCVEGGIGQQQHGALQSTQQAAGVNEFTIGFGSEGGGQDRTGAALDHNQQPQQRVAELHALPAAFGIAPGDSLVVGHVQQGAVHGHSAQAPVERAGLAAVGEGSGQRLEQAPQRLDSPRKRSSSGSTSCFP
ncbi:hypothetical protein OG991_60930 [Streptomyces mirabilis]|nr:hypothetical protein [Streptomyces mirabilis]MCX4429478.1 hypothetical protein [Streptomyces mirabilis]